MSHADIDPKSLNVFDDAEAYFGYWLEELKT